MLTNVKDMYGTKDFFDFPVEVRKCQNEESVLECRSKAYLELGKKRCGCIPHRLRPFHRTVRYWNFSLIAKLKPSPHPSPAGLQIRQGGIWPVVRLSWSGFVLIPTHPATSSVKDWLIATLAKLVPAKLAYLAFIFLNPSTPIHQESFFLCCS